MCMEEDLSLGDKVEFKSKDKITNKGNKDLFDISEWISPQDINNEEKILMSPLMHESFERILLKHKPTSQTAFLSLCTASRPYDKSVKWKAYVKNFDKKVDFIVVSNGGMIPKQFWNSYPYLTYDGGDHYDVEMYQYIMFYRMVRFFRQHKYKFVIANFRPNLINYEPAHKSLKLLKELGFIEDYVVVPDEETYNKAKDLGWRPPHGVGDMFPDLTQTIFSNITEQVEKFGDKVEYKPTGTDEWSQNL